MDISEPTTSDIVDSQSNVAEVNVAMVIQGFYPHVGGAEQQLLALLPLLRARGANAIVITRRLPGTPTYEVINGTEIYRCRMLPGRALGAISFILWGLYFLRKNKPQCIHAFDLLSPVTTSTLYRAIASVPVVAKVLRGGVSGDMAKVRLKKLTVTRLWMLRNFVDRYQVISSEIERELHSVGIMDQKIEYIPNGVVLDRFSPLKNTDEKINLRRDLGIPVAGILCIAVGRLIAEKNLGMLIAAWNKLDNLPRESKLFILGEGPEADYLKAVANQNPEIVFIGRTERVDKYLKAADLFIHVSISEGQSNAILEALSAGLPVFSTNVGAAAEQVKPGYNGWLVPEIEEECLRNTLNTAIASRNEFDRMGMNSRNLVESKYDINKTADCLARLYRELADSKSRK